MDTHRLEYGVYYGKFMTKTCMSGQMASLNCLQMRRLSSVYVLLCEGLGICQESSFNFSIHLTCFSVRNKQVKVLQSISLIYILRSNFRTWWTSSSTLGLTQYGSLFIKLILPGTHMHIQSRRDVRWSLEICPIACLCFTSKLIPLICST